MKAFVAVVFQSHKYRYGVLKHAKRRCIIFYIENHTESKSPNKNCLKVVSIERPSSGHEMLNMHSNATVRIPIVTEVTIFNFILIG
jgi:hypothetical protein